MGKQKLKLIKSINLGEPGSPARILAEMYIKQKGNNKFSEFVRRFIFFNTQKDRHSLWGKESSYG